MVQNILRPSIRHPDSVRVATVPGRVRSWPGSLMAAASTTPSSAISLSDEAKARGAALRPGRDRDLAAALHVEHRHQVHAHADRYRGVAARQPTGRDDEVMRGRHAEPTELDGDRRREEAGGLERVDRLERKAAVAVVLRRARGQLLRSCSATATRRAPASRIGL